ncbi:MAG: hypothetical protein ACE5FA_00705 [Dehalococcoidia bacterium]
MAVPQVSAQDEMRQAALKESSQEERAQAALRAGTEEAQQREAEMKARTEAATRAAMAAPGFDPTESEIARSQRVDDPTAIPGAYRRWDDTVSMLLQTRASEALQPTRMEVYQKAIAAAVASGVDFGSQTGTAINILLKESGVPDERKLRVADAMVRYQQILAQEKAQEAIKHGQMLGEVGLSQLAKFQALVEGGGHIDTAINAWQEEYRDAAARGFVLGGGYKANIAAVQMQMIQGAGLLGRMRADAVFESRARQKLAVELQSAKDAVSWYQRGQGALRNVNSAGGMLEAFNAGLGMQMVKGAVRTPVDLTKASARMFFSPPVQAWVEQMLKASEGGDSVAEAHQEWRKNPTVPETYILGQLREFMFTVLPAMQAAGMDKADARNILGVLQRLEQAASLSGSVNALLSVGHILGAAIHAGPKVQGDLASIASQRNPKDVPKLMAIAAALMRAAEVTRGNTQPGNVFDALTSLRELGVGSTFLGVRLDPQMERIMRPVPSDADRFARFDGFFENEGALGRASLKVA